MAYQLPMLKLLHILVQLSKLVGYGVQTVVQGYDSALKPLTVFIVGHHICLSQLCND